MSDAGLQSVEWHGELGEGRLRLLDQRRLPAELVYHDVGGIQDLHDAIQAMVVRGAPAIGIAAAYGMAQHLRDYAEGLPAASKGEELESTMAEARELLAASRPTAVNLQWALERLRDCADRHMHQLTARELAARMLMEARRIQREDAQLCARIGELGSKLLPDAGGVYTHCHTGALATGGIGTALGCIRIAHAAGKRLHVFAGETRPLLQGARLTCYELMQADIQVTLCCDSAAGSLMARQVIRAVIIGADRIAGNGDTINKIGSYPLAVLARHHGIPFYVAAPYSSFDLALDDGHEARIEERDPDEVAAPLGGPRWAPANVHVSNHAFDVTPAELITAIITERGVIDAPDAEKVRTLMDNEPGEPAV